MTTITVGLSRAGADFEMPDGADLKRLREVVLAEYPSLRDNSDRRVEEAKLREFADALWASAFFYRTDTPNSHFYFGHWVDAASALLTQAGRQSISGGAFLTAVIAAGDVCFQLPGAGAVLEVGLDEYRGRPATNAWRRTLEGELLKPAPARPVGAPPDSLPRPTVWRGWDGKLVNDRGEVW